MSKHRNFWKAGTCVPFLSWYVSLYSAVFKGALYAVWRPQKGLLAISDFNISWLPLLAFSLMTWGGASSTPLIKEGWREKQRQRSAVWGKDFFQFLAALAVLPRSIWKDRMLNKICHQMATNLAFASVSILLLYLDPSWQAPTFWEKFVLLLLIFV